jgi:hypothetical protein
MVEEARLEPRQTGLTPVSAGVESETTESSEAYARFPEWQFGPPASWEGLPWG